MPLPLIPLLLGGGSAILGATGLVVTKKARGRMARAKERFEQKKSYFEQRRKQYESKGQEMEAAFSKVGVTKCNATAVLGKAADYLENATVADRELDENAPDWRDNATKWRLASNNVRDLLTGSVGAGASGLSAAAGVTGLVGIFGTASTGTAISTLTGIAAKNATLAWLGGGSLAVGGSGVAMGTAVVGGFVAGPAVLAFGITQSRSATKIERESAEKCARIEVAIARMSDKDNAMDQVIRRANELDRSILELTSNLSSILESVENNSDADQYKVYKCAAALAELVDTSLLT